LSPADVTAPPLLVFDHVRKAFGEQVILDDLSFSVAVGERVAVIGPSGTGKTTLLRMAMGLEPPDSGEVRFKGVDLWHERRRGRPVPASERSRLAHSREIGMVFQHFYLFPHLSVLENVTLALRRVAGMSKSEAVRVANGALEEVDVVRLAHRKPAHLSGGERQRVAIARALALDPKLLLLDEVTSALDPELVGEVLRVIRGVAVNRGVAMVVVTHEIPFAVRIADRLLMLDSGQIVEQGVPSELIANPTHERTRRFLRKVGAG
jgi:polar amino acid transport system ATP-binding protein